MQVAAASLPVLCMLGCNASSQSNGHASLAASPVTRQRSLMRMSPSGLCIILSMPLGPIDERISRATDFAAMMLALCASRPLSLLFLPCS